MQAEIDSLRVRDRIRRSGRIPRRDLDVLIDGATALAFPSSYRGVRHARPRGHGPALPGHRADRHGAPRGRRRRGGARRSRTTPRVGPTPCDGCSTILTSGRVSPNVATHAPGSSPGNAPSRALSAAYDAAFDRMRRERARALSALRARPGADRGGDDQHRRRARRARPRAPRGHLAAVVRAPRGRGGMGRSARTARDDRLGHDHPRPPVPDGQAEHPCPGDRVRRVHRAGRAGRAPVARSPDVVLAMSPPLTLGDRRGGRARRRARCRSCSTSRTCSPTSPSSSGADQIGVPSRRLRGSSGTTYRGADAVTVLSEDLARQRAGQADVDARAPAARSGEGTRDPELRRHRLDPAGSARQRVSGRASVSPASGRDVRRKRRACRSRSTSCSRRPPRCATSPTSCS